MLSKLVDVFEMYEGALAYPEHEPNGEELVGTHLGPGPVPKLLSIGHGEEGGVRPSAVLDTSTLHIGLLLGQES